MPVFKDESTGGFEQKEGWIRYNAFGFFAGKVKSKGNRGLA